MTIAKYTILSGGFASSLSATVNEHIQQGWKPLGSVAVSTEVSSASGTLFAQAMIKKNKQTERQSNVPSSTLLDVNHQNSYNDIQDVPPSQDTVLPNKTSSLFESRVKMMSNSTDPTMNNVHLLSEMYLSFFLDHKVPML
ncbi:hypothetical protein YASMINEVIRUS_1158 [Yasminevirus sp. GU-2018]|uniref:DUF1737 domain-containing protein n=1 Tax=Yasminevirus sp. GU-2018 TaxID=2420051 RepID=A0A5K0UAU6_9VIRU|nr:hypothetical protein YASMINEVIRUS_1158 [Yasminevirus sp. GU-2018]